MSNQMLVFLRMQYDGGRMAAGLGQAESQLRRFSDGASRHFSGLRKQAHELNAAMGGISGITRLAGAYMGLQAARSAITSNMDFSKTMLEAKQLAEMTEDQHARLRQAALDVSKSFLAGPQEMAQGIQQMANAGVKFDDIQGSLYEGARAAAAFRSEFRDIANMDTDLMQKASIAAKDLTAVHNLLYVHSKAGRFEAKSLSQFAPVYLSELKHWGIGGVQGVNFGGALLQSLQKIVPASEPGEVVTLLKHGFSHLAQPNVLKNLQKHFGIDPRKYAPGGKFGSVDDVLSLAEEMKRKGMQDPFKAGKVFREEFTRKFWLQVMEDVEEIRKAMREGERAMLDDNLGKDVGEIMASDYGKMKQAGNRVEAAKQGGAVSQATNAWARMVEYATQNPLQAGVGGFGLLMAGNLAYRRIRYGKGGGAGGLADAAMGMAGVQRVFVVNMPGAGVGGGQLALPPGAGWNPSEAAKPSRLSGALGAAKGALKWGAPLALLAAGFDAYGVAQNNQMDAQAKKLEYGRIAGGTAGGLGGAALGALLLGLALPGVGAVPGALIGGWLGNYLGEKGGRAAAEKYIIQNTIQIDGRTVAEQVREHTRDAGLRH